MPKANTVAEPKTEVSFATLIAPDTSAPSDKPSEPAAPVKRTSVKTKTKKPKPIDPDTLESLPTLPVSYKLVAPEELLTTNDMEVPPVVVEPIKAVSEPEPEPPVKIEPEPVQTVLEPPPVVVEPVVEPPPVKTFVEPPPIRVERVREPIDMSGFNDEISYAFQKLEEKAAKAQEALEKEEKFRKELEALNSKLLAEKTALLDSLSGEKGALQDYQEKCAKLTAQKNDLDNQLRVSWEKCHIKYLTHHRFCD